MRTALVAIGLTALSTYAEFKVTDSFRMYVRDYKSGKQIIYWSRNASRWPSNCKGFWIVRKEVGSPDWVRVNKALLYPRTSADFDPSILMTDEEEMARIKARMPTVVASFAPETRRLLELPAGTDLRKKSREIGATPAMFCMSLEDDPDVAYFSNLAVYDTGVTKGKDYLYGLLPEYDNQVLAKEPEIVFDQRASTPDAYRISNFSGELDYGELFIDWSINIRNSALISFDVFRKQSKDADYVLIDRNPGFIKGDILDFAHVDKDIPEDFDRLYYKFVPIHKFGKKIDVVSYWEFEKKKQ